MIQYSTCEAPVNLRYKCRIVLPGDKAEYIRKCDAHLERIKAEDAVYRSIAENARRNGKPVPAYVKQEREAIRKLMLKMQRIGVKGASR